VRNSSIPCDKLPLFPFHNVPRSAFLLAAQPRSFRRFSLSCLFVLVRCRCRTLRLPRRPVEALDVAMQGTKEYSSYFECPKRGR
jgi:hypothetical protein